MASNNPRYKNYAARTALRKQVKSLGLPCALCGQPIDYTLPVGDPWSYELDEIIPVSRGGSPTDFNNVQPVHRRCNQKKGNKIFPTKIDEVTGRLTQESTDRCSRIW